MRNVSRSHDDSLEQSGRCHHDCVDRHPAIDVPHVGKREARSLRRVDRRRSENGVAHIRPPPPPFRDDWHWHHQSRAANVRQA